MTTIIILNGFAVEAVNMTPHALSIYDAGKENVIATIPSSGIVRVAETVRVLSDGDGEVPLIKVVRDTSQFEGLPEEVPGRIVIVSDIAYQAAKPLGRRDMVKVGPAVRDDSGRIIGCQGLAI